MVGENIKTQANFRKRLQDRKAMSYTISCPVKSISLEKFSKLIKISGRHKVSSIKYDLKQYLIECNNFHDAKLIVEEMSNIGMKANMID